MKELKPCPFCGGEGEVNAAYWDCHGEKYESGCANPQCLVHPYSDLYDTEEEAIEAWNTRAAMEFDNWFYLPKPKEPIVKVTETTNAWDGAKVRTDVFYQVREHAVHKWAKELDEHIIKRICEVWDTRAERTCTMERDEWYPCAEDGCKRLHMPRWFCSECENDTVGAMPDYCPNCGAKVVSE